MHTAHTARQPAALWQFVLVALGVGYPIGRAILPGTVQPALLVPLLLLLAWAGWLFFRPPANRRSLVQTPLGVPLLLGGLSLALSSVVAVADPVTVAATLFDWVQVAVLLFLALYVLAAGWNPRLFTGATILAISLLLLAGAWAVGGWWLQWALLWQPGEPWLPVGFRKPIAETHPNQVALLLNIGIPLVIGALWQARQRWQQVLWALWLLLATVIMFYTSSRGGWLAMVATVGVVLAPLLWSALRQKRWRRLWLSMLLAAGYATLFLTLFLFNLRDIEAQRNLRPPPDATLQQQQAAPPAQTVSRLTNTTGRTVFWQRALEFFQERPLLGVGPEGYATRYAAVEPHSRFFAAPHAHSIYLTALSESGILGSVALASLALAALWRWWQGWRRAAPLLAVAANGRAVVDPGGRVLLLSGGASLFSVGVHGLVEVPTIDSLGIALYTAAAALAVGGTWRLQAAPAPVLLGAPLWRRAVRAIHPLHLALVGCALLAWGSAAFLVQERANYREGLDTARQAVQQGDFEAALAHYNQSLARYPWGSAASSERATTLAWLARSDPERLPAALAAQQLAATHDPTNLATPANRAALLLAMGQTSEATELLRGFIDAHRRWVAPVVLLAGVLEQTGETSEAQALWQRALALDATVADSAACLQSAVCAALPPADNRHAALVQARQLRAALAADAPAAEQQATLEMLERLGFGWDTVDMLAVGALAAQDVGAEQTAERFLTAAVDKAEIVGRKATPQLALALLTDALARNDEADLRRLLHTWVAPPDMQVVPQLSQPLLTTTERELARLLVVAAERVGEPRMLAQAVAYQERVERAFAAAGL